MTITVAICTWNRVGLLARTLEEFAKIRARAGIVWEVLVVDNGSTDGTSAFLRSFQPTGYRLRSVTEAQLGLSAARNRALIESQTEIIFYTDDDVLVDPDLLTALVDAAERHPRGSAFGGVIDPWFPVEPDPILMAAFPALRRGFCGVDLSLGEGALPEGRHVIGANMGYRRSHIDGLRFREDLGPKGLDTIGGDEMVFQDQIRARGGAIVWVPSMRLRHYVDPSRMTLSYLLRFAEDVGRKEIRLHGVPVGARVAGVPRWLLGNAAKEHARALLSRVRVDRTQALVHGRRAAEFGGMIKECRGRYLRDRKAPAVSAAATS